MPAISSTERIYLRMERPGFPCDIAGINVLEPSPEGALPFEAVRAVFDQRRHHSPLLTLMLAPAPLGIGEDRWTQAASLDIDAHVHHRQVPPPGDMQALLATVLEVSKDPLDRSRPLWEAWYLSGMAGGAAALLLRTHHAAIDGMGVLQLHRVLFDTEPTIVDLGAHSTPVAGRPFPSLLRRALFEVPSRVATEVVTTGRIVKRVGAAVPEAMGGKTGACGPRDGAQAGVAAASQPCRTRWRCRSCPGTSPHRRITRRSRCSTGTWDNPGKSMAVISVPLNQVKQVRRGFPDVTVNDILFALVTGSLREYLIANDDLSEVPLRATCPVNIRLARRASRAR